MLKMELSDPGTPAFDIMGIGNVYPAAPHAAPIQLMGGELGMSTTVKVVGIVAALAVALVAIRLIFPPTQYS